MTLRYHEFDTYIFDAKLNVRAAPEKRSILLGGLYPEKICRSTGTNRDTIQLGMCMKVVPRVRSRGMKA
jgi:hypothetical protein